MLYTQRLTCTRALAMLLNKHTGMLQMPSGRTQTIVTAFLILAEPRLLRLAKDSFGPVVHEMPSNNEDKRDWIDC